MQPSWELVELPKIQDARGNLTFAEGRRHLPFDIARVYYLYDVPSGATRAGHAHKELQQLLIAIAGSFEIHLDDGARTKTIFLNRPSTGLLLRSRVWRTIDNFSAGSVCLALASMPYDEADYFRDYQLFKDWLAGQQDSRPQEAEGSRHSSQSDRLAD